ncbi:alginate lyase family protein [Planktotalea sp.]|uniref:alginate lyase family protein n=1 Tax=Planktotalea sp. TaxID=2029877 RepID=UPI00329A1282
MKYWLTSLILAAPLPALATCVDVPAPPVSLSFESRYKDNDLSRSEIDPQAEADAKAALKVLDDFISDLATRSDAALLVGDGAEAACIMDALVHWAEADALSVLATPTVQLTIGSRLAALALITRKVAPISSPEHTAVVSAWLARRMKEQMTFWERAPNGAAQGNLRAWSALAGTATALLTHDPIMLGWSAWSVEYVACTANEDGSLPQEMSRKTRALHYQLHAVAPLTLAAAMLEENGISMLDRCGQALDRIVTFTMDDLNAGGIASAEHAGAEQTLNGGLDGVKDFQLAWGEAWLSLRDQASLETALSERRPLKYSKLGGDQTRIWAE